VTRDEELVVLLQYRTRWSSIEWSCSLGVRIADAPSEPEVEYALTHFPVDEQYTAPKDVQNGWKQFAWFHIASRRREHSQCVISPKTMRAVHATLFGDAGRPLAARVALKDTARLLLAAVGIAFDIADTKDSEGDGYDDPGYGSLAHLALGDRAPGVTAARLRKVCGLAPLPGDKGAFFSFQLRPHRSLSSIAVEVAGKKQVTEPLDDESEDEERGPQCAQQ
jgi:hypothetical protein